MAIRAGLRMVLPRLISLLSLPTGPMGTQGHLGRRTASLVGVTTDAIFIDKNKLISQKGGPFRRLQPNFSIQKLLGVLGAFRGLVGRRSRIDLRV